MPVLEHENRTLHEPMIRINGTGWGFRIATLIQVCVLLGAAGSGYAAFSLVQYKQDQIGTSLETGISALESKIDKAALQLDRRIDAVEEIMEKNKEVRSGEINELRNRTEQSTAVEARLSEQIKNLQLLLGDMRGRINPLSE